MDNFNKKYEEEEKWKANFNFPQPPFIQNFNSSTKHSLYNVKNGRTDIYTHPAVFLYIKAENNWNSAVVSVSQFGEIVREDSYLNPSVENKEPTDLDYNYLLAISGDLKTDPSVDQESKKMELQNYGLVAQELKQHINDANGGLRLEGVCP